MKLYKMTTVQLDRIHHNIRNTGHTVIMLQSSPAPLTWSGLTSTSVNMDLIVTAGGTPFPCNKTALVAASGYFAHQLQLTTPTTSPAPLTLDLPSVPADVFKSLLLYIYTGHLEVDTGNVYQLFWYSQMLQIPGAVLKCSQFISDKINATSRDENNSTKNIAEQSKTEHTSTDQSKTTIIKPIARPGVPLMSLTANSLSYHQQFLRPHLASFYSDWFLRYTSLTRNNEDVKVESTMAPTTSSVHKENEGNHIFNKPGKSRLLSIYGVWRVDSMKE